MGYRKSLLPYISIANPWPTHLGINVIFSSMFMLKLS